MRDDPVLVNITGSGELLSNENNRSNRPNFLVDAITTLQLIKEIGNGDLVVWVADLSGLLDSSFNRFVCLDCKRALLLVLFCGLEDGFTELLFDFLGFCRSIVGQRG